MCACKNLRCAEWIFLQFNTEEFYNNCEVINILIVIRTLKTTLHNYICCCMHFKCNLLNISGMKNTSNRSHTEEWNIIK